MRYRRACSLVAATVLLASVTAATTSRMQVSPVVRASTVGSSPLALAVDGQRQRVFVANFGSATVSMLDAGSGAVLATTAVVPYPDTLAIATTPGHVFVASSVTSMNPDRVNVLDAGSGRLLRTVAVGQGGHALAVDGRSGHVFITNAPDNNVSMVDARSGAVLRTIPVGPNPLAVTVDEHVGHAFVLGGGLWQNEYPSGRSTVDLLDTRSGAVLHTVAVGIGASAIAVDARSGHVFVANDFSRSVSMVEARSGRVLRTTAVDLNPWSIAVDQRVDRVVVSTGKGLWPTATAGQVQVLDGRTGRGLRMVAVGLGPAALAVEERSGYVFVVNSYGTPASSGGMSRLVAWSRQWLPARGQQWLSRLAQSPPPRRTLPGTVTVLDPSRL